MSSKSEARIGGLAAEKMNANGAIILENVDKIEVAIRDLRAAASAGHMDDMSDALRTIVDCAIGCRSRLQFMRGVWALYRDYRGGKEARPNGRDTRVADMDPARH